jgi:hypothetical protein
VADRKKNSPVNGTRRPVTAEGVFKKYISAKFSGDDKQSLLLLL